MNWPCLHIYIRNYTTETHAFPNVKSRDVACGITMEKLNIFHFQIQLYVHFDVKIFLQSTRKVIIEKSVLWDGYFLPGWCRLAAQQNVFVGSLFVAPVQNCLKAWLRTSEINLQYLGCWISSDDKQLSPSYGWLLVSVWFPMDRYAAHTAQDATRIGTDPEEKPLQSTQWVAEETDPAFETVTPFWNLFP